MLTAFPEVRSIHWAVNDTPGQAANLPSQLLWGEEAIEEEIGGLRFRLRPNAFLQTNTGMAERLYELVRAEAGLTGGETVYDLYCGIGTIALALARDALTVWGVEISEESVACAIENAELNAIGNAAFFAGNVGEVLRELKDRAGEPDVVVVDPPRAGLAGKGLRRLGELAAPTPRLRLLQPDDARGRHEAPRRGVRLPARAHAPARHVPAHAARRVRLASDAQVDALEAGRLTTSRRQIRSAFGRRKPSAIAGRAGSPPVLQTVVSAIVAPSPAVIPSHVQNGRRWKRMLAPRKREKNITSGRPRRAALPPGTTKAIESFVNTAGWWAVIAWVGPRQTEKASTQGMIKATVTTHESASKADRKSSPAPLTAANFAMLAGTGAPSTEQRRETPIRTATPIASGIGRRQIGRASQVRLNIAGIRTSATSATLGQVESAERWGAVSNQATSAPTAISKAAARPTTDRPA